MPELVSPARSTGPIGPHRVLILGGGFAGLRAAKALRRAPVEVTLVDRRNHHLFQPLLYQVATGALSPADIAAPLRGLLARQPNARVLQGEVRDVDPARRRILLAEGELPYDTLLVATGAKPAYFGNDAWEPDAPGLKDLLDATRIRSRVLSAFERAERATDAAERTALLSFVVVGGGPTGVELAGALAELSRDTLRHDFRSIDPTQARIRIVEAGGRVLPAFPPELSARAMRSLGRLGVEVLTGTRVTDLDDGRVAVRDGEREISIPARTVLWAAGIQASHLGRILAERAGAALDPMGRVRVEANLSLLGHPDILVLGDLACCPGRDGAPLPGVAPVAMQQGRYAARLIRDRLHGRSTRPFRYRNRGNLATIGRSAAVADLGRLRFGGFIAWLLWLFVHLMYLVDFANRVLVFFQWAWNYFTRNRTARLITLDPGLAEPTQIGQPEIDSTPEGSAPRAGGKPDAGATSARGS